MKSYLDFEHDIKALEEELEKNFKQKNESQKESYALELEKIKDQHEE